MEKLIGQGCDVTDVNIAPGRLRGYLDETVPWTVKDALTLFYD